jgi:proteasome lid subunit RPN8/RPN11
MSGKHHDTLILEMIKIQPIECCGILLGQVWSGENSFGNKIRPVGEVIDIVAGRNVLESPTEFRLHEDDYMRAIRIMDNRLLKMLAIYHSHPDGDSYPSDRDLGLATNLDVLHVILSWESHYPMVKAFRIIEGEGDTLEMYYNRVYEEVEVVIE